MSNAKPERLVRISGYMTERVVAWFDDRSPLQSFGKMPGELGKIAEVREPGYTVEFPSTGERWWYPEAVFKQTFSPDTAMDFSVALTAMKEGHMVQRPGGPALALDSLAGLSRDDLLAEDWSIVSL